MFQTQEKVLRRIFQDREKGDLARARRRALDGLEKWPDDLDIAMEAVQLSFEMREYREAIKLIKSAVRHHPREKSRLIDFAREVYVDSGNPSLGSFLLEASIRGRDIDAACDLLRRSPDSVVEEFAAHARTRQRMIEESGEGRGAAHTETALLLGLCLHQVDRPAEASAALGASLRGAPECAHDVGELLVQIEREIPDDAGTKFSIGLASIILGHSEQAEKRFFQCLELEDPPLERLRTVLENHPSPTPAHELLLGETLVRMGETEAGVSRIAEFLKASDKHPAEDGEVHRLLSGPIGRTGAAARRLALLAAMPGAESAVIMLYAETAASLEQVADAVTALENAYARDASLAPAIRRFIEEREEVSLTGPAQRLLARMHLESGRWDEATAAVRRSAELDRSQLGDLSELVDEAIVETNEPALRLLRAELFAIRGDAERAGRIARELEETGEAEGDDLMRITGSILSHCGVTIENVSAAVYAAIRGNSPAEAIPWINEYLHGDGDGAPLADAIVEAANTPELWRRAAVIIDGLDTNDPGMPLRILQARAHLESGAVERAVLEFDGIIMRNESFRYDLLEIYENALERFDDNPTLHLALYHLHLDEDRPVQAARHLCRTLELDPGQIRDVLERFDAIAASHPTERGVWEALLDAAVRMKHGDLARETLRRALAELPETDAAALHLYGARISADDDDSENGLRCIALALTAPEADLRAIETELRRVLEHEPGNPEAAFLLGDCMLQLGDEQSAVESFERCIDNSAAYGRTVRERVESILPMSVEPATLSRLLGEIAWRENRTDDARRLFATAQAGPAGGLAPLGHRLDAALREQPGEAGIALLLAKNRVLEDRFDEALSILGNLADAGDRDREVTNILEELLRSQPGHAGANRLLATILRRGSDPSASLEPVLRLLDSSGPPVEIEETVAPFIDILSDEPRFLVPRGRLLARLDRHEEALAALRRALETDPGCWEPVLGALDTASWPAGVENKRRLLRADALIAGERYEPAFTVLSSAGSSWGSAAAVVERVERIVDAAPAADRYSFGARLHAGEGNIEDAEALLRLGIERLGGDDALDLRIELAELLERNNHRERAAGIFREVLDETDDRAGVLRRIERSSLDLARREIEDGVARLENLSPGDAERLARLAVDCGVPESATAIVARAALDPCVRAAILARAYLSLDRPLLALAAVGAVDRRERRGDDVDAELLYIEGTASERIGDRLRAASAFGRIAALRGDWLDAAERACMNYGMTLESTDDAAVLVKTGALEPVAAEREDRS